MSKSNGFVNASHDFYKPSSAGDTAFYPVGPSLTRQEFADECDINVIMARYEKTGMLPVNASAPRYMDLTVVPGDLQTAMNYMSDAQEAFMQLPAKIRREFDNDATAFVEFATDPNNLDQMRDWGLAAPAAAPVLAAPTTPSIPASPAAAAAPAAASAASPAPAAAPAQSSP